MAPADDARVSKPVPEVTDAMRPFFDAAREHRLVVQQCRSCKMLRFPARELCNRCLSLDAEWVEVSGRGVIFSYNVMHQVYHPGFAAEVPYAVVIVELAEGLRMISNVVDLPVDQITIDMPVEVVFEAISPLITLPKFRPVQG
jgi:uncharacterized OB-fold protein